MKRMFIAACLTILTANQGFALSCMRPSVEESYTFFAESEARYILVSGQLTKKRNVVRGPVIQNGIGERRENFTATFVGHQATRSGFDKPVELAIAVSANCTGPWCGTVNVNTPLVAFVEITPYGHKLSEGPCDWTVFYNPTKDQIDRVLQCLRGGVCTRRNR